MKIVTVKANMRKRVATRFEEPSKADQSQKEQCDVNVIMRKYNKTGQINHINRFPGRYADVSEIPDLLQASVQLREAQLAFNALPAELRKKLNNDPINLVAYLNDPKNDEEAISFGLKSKKAGPDIPGSRQDEVAPENPPRKPKKSIIKSPAPNDDNSNDDEQ